MTRGLSESDISTRRSEYGYNELESAHENMCVRRALPSLTVQVPQVPVVSVPHYSTSLTRTDFQGPVLYAMEIAVVLAAGLQDWSVAALWLR